MDFSKINTFIPFIDTFIPYSFKKYMQASYKILKYYSVIPIFTSLCSSQIPHTPSYRRMGHLHLGSMSSTMDLTREQQALIE